MIFKCIKKCLKLLVPSMGSVLIFIAIIGTIKFVEPVVFPVISDFRVNDINYLDKGNSSAVVISGTMFKNRNCSFMNLAAYAHYDGTEIPKGLVNYEFMDVITRSRALGDQQWGPWKITLPQMPKAEKIELVATHRCHSLWDTQTTLTKFLLIKEGNQSDIIAPRE